MKKNNRFTLIELLVVIAVISILMAILLPAIAAVRRNAKEARARADVHAIALAIKAFDAEYNQYPTIGSGSSGVVTFSDAPGGQSIDTLIRVLACADPGLPGQLWTDAADSGNKRVIRFLELPQKYYTDRGLNDPWGNRYIVKINYGATAAELITITDFPGSTSVEVPSSVAVYSKGVPDADRGIGSWQ